MFYADTSVLVAVFTQEDASKRATAWLRRSESEGVAISEWVAAEFAAALSTKIRTKQIDEGYRDKAFSLFTTTVKESIQVAAVTEAHFKRAAQFAHDYKLGLRAGDALHLAIASDQKAVLCTLDKRLASAGKALGLASQLI
jgi:predicted nucleic acid-binding protein